MRRQTIAVSLGGFLALSAVLSNPAGLTAGQDNNSAAKIYRDCSQSVVLLSVKDEKGEKVGQATGFVIAGGKIVTNEHVVRAGLVFIESGVALVPAPAKVTDTFNDLAILEPGIELAVAPLPLAQKAPAPGDPVFTISNPAGLEKSISTGVVSSIREFEGHRLIQITAPISHGSSGGPVLNERGEVIGVAMGILDEGQNLNFAVPAEKVVELLSGKTTALANPYALLDETISLKSALSEMDYSKEEASPYQRTRAKMRDCLNNAFDSSGKDVALLMRITEVSAGIDAEIGVLSAEKAVGLEPTMETKLALGNALVSAHYGRDKAQKTETLKRAESMFRECVKLSKAPDPAVLSALAGALESLESFVEAERDFTEALRLYEFAGNADGQAKCLTGLVRIHYASGKPEAGNAAFKSLVGLDKATPWDWWFQAQRLEDAGQYHDAGEHYERSAELNEEWLWFNWKEAARMFVIIEKDHDRALYCARKCIAAGSGQEGSEGNLAYSHRIIAIVLNRRGVYQEALNHARESVVLDPEDAWAYDAQAEALIGLRRYLEATNASNQAIRLSDGKYYGMHFNLAFAYFNLENWELAAQSYKKAVELNKSDPSSPYNLALCMLKLGYYDDAARWFEEVLRRNPNHPDRQSIQSRISTLRRAS